VCAQGHLLVRGSGKHRGWKSLLSCCVDSSEQTEQLSTGNGISMPDSVQETMGRVGWNAGPIGLEQYFCELLINHLKLCIMMWGHSRHLKECLKVGCKVFLVAFLFSSGTELVNILVMSAMYALS